ncbi:MAG: threonine synthase [Thaumarchaeota archaeon]|nr:threonine synthase [Nitrososphaerota archaeon]
MGQIGGLRCRECSKEYDPSLRYVCEECFGPLDVFYDYDAIKVTPETFAPRDKTMWRYFELLPLSSLSSVVNLWQGFTPLHRSKRLAAKLGLRELYLKNDSVNPTFSFKDRPAGVGVSRALELELKAIGCASTGNLAAATAAHAAVAGLPCYVFIPVGLELPKVAQALTYGPRIVEVEGDYDDANRLAAQAADAFNIGVLNINLRPYYVEGSKTLAFEVAEQLGWEQPDHVIVPVGSGAMLHSICKGFEELRSVGLLDEIRVKVSAAQGQGCAPIVDAFKRGLNEVIPVENPDTVAKSLAIGEPGDGLYALKKVRKYNGYAEEASDKEIVDAIRLLAETEGIFTEPAGGVSVAVLKKMVDDGKIGRDEKVVCYITGNGLKTPEVVLESLPRPIVVKPDLEVLAPYITGR